jgi:hypothetical protein
MNFDIGYINNGFVTDQGRNCAELDQPFVLVTNHPIATIRVRGPPTHMRNTHFH